MSWETEENGKKIKEQQTGARRVSRRFKSSQVLYAGGNYRGWWGGETDEERERETGGEEGGERQWEEKKYIYIHNKLGRKWREREEGEREREVEDKREKPRDDMREMR